MTLVQVPSSSHPGETHRVNLRLRHCDCTGFKHRGRCTHLRQAQQHPERFVPGDEPLGGLWTYGAELPSHDQPSETSYLDTCTGELHPISLLDQHHISVLVDCRVGTAAHEHGALRALLLEKGVAYMWAGEKPNGGEQVAHRQRKAAIYRMAKSRRVVMLMDGSAPWKEVKLG